MFMHAYSMYDDDDDGNYPQRLSIDSNFRSSQSGLLISEMNPKEKKLKQRL